MMAGFSVLYVLTDNKQHIAFWGGQGLTGAISPLTPAFRWAMVG
jgi:hypothetical protein